MVGPRPLYLSNGHGSMLQYALLHLTGFDLSMDDLKAFRQLGSRTPGHPEVDITPGVETTTGPLGQGIANGVGMALAEKLLAAEFNRDGFPVVDNRTYVFLGDGCLMEGISMRSAHWRASGSSISSSRFTMTMVFRLTVMYAAGSAMTPAADSRPMAGM